MLVMSRKKNESIIINDDIIITVVEIRGDKVRLGVEGPKEVPVHRNEVYEAIRRCNYESTFDRDGAASTRKAAVTRPKARSEGTVRTKAMDETVSRLPDVSPKPSVNPPVQRERSTSARASWLDTVGRGWRTVQGWFNKLMAVTVPATMEPSSEPERPESARQESPQGTGIGATRDQSTDAGVAAANETARVASEATEAVIASPRAKKRSPRETAAKQATAKGGNKKAARKTAVKKASPRKSATKTTAAKSSPKRTGTTKAKTTKSEAGESAQPAKTAIKKSTAKKTSGEKGSSGEKPAPRKRTPK